MNIPDLYFPLQLTNTTTKTSRLHSCVKFSYGKQNKRWQRQAATWCSRWYHAGNMVRLVLFLRIGILGIITFIY